MKYSVGKIIKIFRKELISIYPLHEINSFIYLILENELHFSKIDIIMKEAFQLSDNQTINLLNILQRLKNSEPLQYILGKAFFYGLDFIVSSKVLIPRPETEELVDIVIKRNQNRKNLDILDIGTGSGCIAVSLGLKLKFANIFAYDISKSALKIAKKNAEKHNVRITTELKDILHEQNCISDQKFDIIVSNPPYVTEKEAVLMDKNVLDYEPHIALFVEDSKALIFYEAICNYAKLNLKSGGLLYFEINEAYGNELVDLLHSFGFQDIELHKDINYKDRMVCAGLVKN